MSTFNHFDDETILEIMDEQGPITLDIIESFASNENVPSDEQELSVMFDAEIAQLVIDQYGDNDGPAMREAFNNWADGLQRDGVIHELQLNHYCYVGKYS